ncbi:MAG: hypothetical protein DRP76_00800 [Candidatus Omnitrophota bacterium]|nr:MAG: hypothetical protein DRP61_04675 [Candidatus Omnitrophota bacterium]RKY40986.1 MAG: hypothetical protein DRP76_00800 [Candidatus Omnitrophota bacterium]RKY43398.1 MAG: hypothetical protein DRP80_05370 [Candidatus Omnitrophota bacterium]
MAARKLKVKLGEILIQIGSLNLEQLKEVLTLQQMSPSKLIGEILIEKGYLQKEDIDTALVIQQGYPYLNISHYKIEPKILRKFPLDLMVKFKFVPLDLVGDVLTIAVSSFSYKSVILKKLKHYKVRIFISTYKEIREVLENYYG